MASICHIEADTGSAGTAADLDAYLDAAREAILAVGWSRTTLTDIARRAGVSRMTLYRRWPDTRSLLADLMTREWTRSLAEVLAPQTDVTLAAVARDLTAGVRALRSNALLARIIELDPERLLPYLLERRGRSQDLVCDLLAERIRRCQQAGTARTGEPVLLARSLVLAAHGFTLSAHTMGDPDRYDDELTRLVRAYLAP